MQFQHARRFWQGLAVGGVAVVTALPATAALGQTGIRHDPAHDVIRLRFNPDGSESTPPLPTTRPPTSSMPGMHTPTGGS